MAHFVDNAALLQAFKDYHAREDVKAFLVRKRAHAAAKARGEARAKFRELAPPLPDPIVHAIWLIANNFAKKPNWRPNNAYLDEMIADAVIYCCKYGYNFDPEKGDKPFSYLTQGVFRAFLQRIAKEKHQDRIVREGIMRASLGQDASYAGESKLDSTTHLKLLAKHVDDLATLEREHQNTFKSRRGRPKKAGKVHVNSVDDVLGV